MNNRMYKRQRLMRCIPLVVIYISTFTVAADASKPVEMIGLGIAKCSEFVSEWESDKKAAIPAYFAWSQGFMTSFNMTRNQKKLPTKTFSDNDFAMEKQLAYLVSYCKVNPARDFAAATIHLYMELPNK